jgi:ATP-dependent Clp protease adaptor protein ClpS
MSVPTSSLPIPDALDLAETQARTAPRFRVICHDDPSTTTVFVVSVLRGVFRLPEARAVERMLCVHHTGTAIIGRYPRSLAERRVQRATATARANGYPLTFTVEQDN